MHRNETKVRVRYAETDAMGIAYHSNYLIWYEIGRTELFREMGIAYAQVEAAGYYLPVTEAYCHYHIPVHYDDVIVVETVLSRLRRASMRFDYRIVDDEGDRTLAEGFTVHGVVNEQGRLVRIPDMIAGKIRKGEE